MGGRVRAVVFAVLVVLVVAVTSGYTIAQLHDSQQARAATPSVPSAAPAALPTHGFVAFRHTGLDNEYGVVALVPIDDPSGPRTYTGVACDRVYASTEGASCLVTDAGVVTKYEADQYDADWTESYSRPLPGLPSRTRISPDGSLVSSTSFVTGHSYMTAGFSTATEIHTAAGKSYGNLEKFRLIDAHGEAIEPKDRNVWGVTFAPDDTTFYATVAYGGHTHLVRGDLTARTLTIIADDVECPSLSPDGTRIAFKQAGNPGGQKGWTPAVLDLATGQRTVLTAETHNVDDQIEWLDDDTILYGLPRADEQGVTDVWSLDTTPGATPRVFIPQAWSPSVVR